MEFTPEERKIIAKHLPKHLVCGMFQYNRMNSADVEAFQAFFTNPELKTINTQLKERGGLIKFLESASPDAHAVWALLIHRDFVFMRRTDPETDPDFSKLAQKLIRSSHYCQAKPKDKYVQLLTLKDISDYIEWRRALPASYNIKPAGPLPQLLTELYSEERRIRESWRKRLETSITQEPDTLYEIWGVYIKKLAQYISPVGEFSTALMLTAHRNDDKIADLLLRSGADVNVVSKTETKEKSPTTTTAMGIAIFWRNSETATVLTRYNPVMINDIQNIGDHNDGHNEKVKPVLTRIVYFGNVSFVRYLLLYNIDVNQKDINGNSALKIAANSGFIDIAKLLLDHGATITEKELAQATMLETQNKTEILALLEPHAIQTKHTVILSKDKNAHVGSSAATAKHTLNYNYVM